MSRQFDFKHAKGLRRWTRVERGGNKGKQVTDGKLCDNTHTERNENETARDTDRNECQSMSRLIKLVIIKVIIK